MIPSFNEIKSACTGVDDELIREHIERLGAGYYGLFPVPEIALHLAGLQKLSGSNPVEILVSITGDNSADITILAFDYPFAFSLITGILGVMGLKIRSGEAFTYRRNMKASSAHREKTPAPAADSAGLPRRRIIDRFRGVVETPVAHEAWREELETKMKAVFALLEKGTIAGAAGVNEMVVDRLAEGESEPGRIHSPVEIRIDNGSTTYTRMRVVSVDTPFFLYTLSTALSLCGISIELVKISTSGKMTRNEFEITDSGGGRIRDAETINRIKLSVLLTKEFSCFLEKAPDPFAALTRFKKLVDDILKIPEYERWLELLIRPRVLKNMARLLGVSDFLWDDYIRRHYESIIPALDAAQDGGFHSSPESIQLRLNDALSAAVTRDDRVRVLNEFKDREIFFTDLEHVLAPGADYRMLSERLSALAACVVGAAAEMAYEDLVSRHGMPRSGGDPEVPYSILGLGKMGGAALGYASDIELLFVYSENGMTDGPEPVENREFFRLLVRRVIASVRAKPEGIFSIDVRLRPGGRDGPLAASLESFSTYYGPGGGALSYERLALTRLRRIGGDAGLGERLERLRDEFIYVPMSIDLRSIREFRERQFREKTLPGLVNAKYNTGALVDLEYSVQILQLLYGVENPPLRTPRIHTALESLAALGILPRGESEELAASYDFLRRLVNGLRMLRGSAGDLFLPRQDSDEYLHLAKRMGYERRGDVNAAQMLFVELETRTAMVRSFVERHLGLDSLPGPAVGNIADIVLAGRLPDGLPERIMKDCGFSDPARGLDNLKHLSAAAMRRGTFAMLAVLACGIVMRNGDPDTALDNWRKFVAAIDLPEGHYETMLSQPKRLEILLGIFSASRFLADTLLRNPGFLNRVIMPENLNKNISGEMLMNELRDMCELADDHNDCLDRMRVVRLREILAIGTRDLVLKAPLYTIGEDLSRLTDAFIGIALEQAWISLDGSSRIFADNNRLREKFCIMAFGRLGGHEMNYNSDIELLGVYDLNEVKHISRPDRIFGEIMKRVVDDLSISGRVVPGIRLGAGPERLAYPAEELAARLGGDAPPAELPALITMRPAAGAMRVGHDFIVRVWPQVLERLKGARISDLIGSQPDEARKTRDDLFAFDTDTVPQIIRDIELFVQGLQLIHAQAHPDLPGHNTVHALRALTECGVLPLSAADEMKQGLIFLRRLENFIQLSGYRRVYELPRDAEELGALVRRVLPAEDLLRRLDAIRQRVKDAYDRYLPEA